MLIIGLLAGKTVYGKTHKVGISQEFKSIKDALKHSTSYDTIMVYKGVYHEKNLLIDKPIVLIGSGLPILDGQRLYEVISIKSDDVKISGFEIRNSGVSSIIDMAGIKVYEASNVIIENNIINEAFFGIYLQYGIDCIIRNNIIHAKGSDEQKSGNGIHCWNSDSLLIEGNKISGHRDGIYFEFVKNSIIKSNQSTKNLRYGLHFMFSNNDTYEHNQFEDNGAGVAVMFSKQVNMFYNTFSQNWGDAAYGILLKEISDGRIENNLFSKNTSGIYMEGSSRLAVNHNSFIQNGWALKIQASCMEVKVNRNNFKGNTFDISTNGSLVLNNFNNNYWDKYEGYDLNRDKIGDVPYRPISLFSVILERNPTAMIMFRSFIASIMDKAEKLIPSLTSENLKDENPLMKPLSL